MHHLYTYKCYPQRVIDGDTVRLIINLGMNVQVIENVRLRGIDAPEIRGSERPEGLKSKDFLEWLLDEPNFPDHSYYCTTYKDRKGKYGRYIVELFVDDNNINDIMVEEGYAEPYVE